MVSKPMLMGGFLHPPPVRGSNNPHFTGNSGKKHGSDVEAQKKNKNETKTKHDGFFATIANQFKGIVHPRTETQRKTETSKDTKIPSQEPKLPTMFPRMLRSTSATNPLTAKHATHRSDNGSPFSPVLLDPIHDEPHIDIQLYEAARNGDYRRVEQILQSGQSKLVNSPLRNNHSSALYGAVHGNHVHIVNLLLDSGAPPNVGNVWGCTPLFLAAQRNFRNCAELLLDAGADTEICASDGVTPLMIAVRWNNLETVKILLASGARMDAIDVFGVGVYDGARENSPTQRWLQRTKGYTALHYACLAFNPNRIRNLMQNPSTDLGAVAANGFTALDVLKFSTGRNIDLKTLREYCQLLHLAQRPISHTNLHLYPKSFQQVYVLLERQIKQSSRSRLAHQERYGLSRQVRKGSKDKVQQVETSSRQFVVNDNTNTTYNRRQHNTTNVNTEEVQLSNAFSKATISDEHSRLLHLLVTNLDHTLLDSVLSFCGRDWFEH